jgi:hypothetical protein
MVTYNKLEAVANAIIPEGNHKYFHVNCREAWIKIVKEVLDNKKLLKKAKVDIENYEAIAKLATNWELVLYNYYSQRN